MHFNFAFKLRWVSGMSENRWNLLLVSESRNNLPDLIGQVWVVGVKTYFTFVLCLPNLTQNKVIFCWHIFKIHFNRQIHILNVLLNELLVYPLMTRPHRSAVDTPLPDMTSHNLPVFILIPSHVMLTSHYNKKISRKI